MSRRAWAVTALLGLVIVACGGAAVLGTQRRAEARDRQQAAQQQLPDAIARVERIRSDVEEQRRTQADLVARAEALRANFTPDVIAAVMNVQADSLQGACALARAATRDATPTPAGTAVVDFAIAAAPTTTAALSGMPDSWGQMVDPTPIQAEIDRCSADEAAVMEAEAAAAAAASEQRFCNQPLFVDGYCPTQGEIDYENQAEGLCGGGDYAAAAAAGIVC